MATRRPADPQSRERLLQAGLALARQRGLRALTVRAVATQAQANLGSFVYHFGTRDAFIAELIEGAYAPLMAGLELISAAPMVDPLDKLRDAILRLLTWALAQRVLIAHVLQDAMAGEAGARRFLQGLDTRHPALLLRLVEEAQRAGRLRRTEPLHQLLFLMTSTAAPVLMFQLITGADAAPGHFARTMDRLAADPERMAQRLEWALQGLAP